MRFPKVFKTYCYVCSPDHSLQRGPNHPSASPWIWPPWARPAQSRQGGSLYREPGLVERPMPHNSPAAAAASGRFSVSRRQVAGAEGPTGVSSTRQGSLETVRVPPGSPYRWACRAGNGNLAARTHRFLRAPIYRSRACLSWKLARRSIKDISTKLEIM